MTHGFGCRSHSSRREGACSHAPRPRRSAALPLGTALGVSKTVCPLSPRPPRLRVRFLRGLCGLCARISTPPEPFIIPQSVSGGFENNRSFNPFVHGLEVGGRAARVPAKCQTIAARTIVATWGIGHRSIGPTGHPGIRPLLGAAGRRTSLAAATAAGSPFAKRFTSPHCSQIFIVHQS